MSCFVCCSSSAQEFLTPAILNVNGETLRRQKSEPLKCLLVETGVRECVLPVRYAQVHYHESKVVGKCICNKEPVAGEILEPDLRLLLTVLAFSVDKRQSPTLAFRIDLVRKNVTFKKSRTAHTYSSTSSSSLESSFRSPRTENRNFSPFILLISRNLFRFIEPKL